MTGTAVNFSALDWAIVALYFVANTAICVWAAMLKEKNTDGLLPREPQRRLVPDRFLDLRVQHRRRASHRARRFRRADSGMAFAHWELHSYLVLVLGWVFAPFYLRANMFTTPEFLERRYTPATRTFLSLHLPRELHPHQGVGHDLRRRLRHPDHPRLPDHHAAVARRHRLLLVRGIVAGGRSPACSSCSAA